jgi:hypothetical protein
MKPILPSRFWSEFEYKISYECVYEIVLNRTIIVLPYRTKDMVTVIKHYIGNNKPLRQNYPIPLLIDLGSISMGINNLSIVGIGGDIDRNASWQTLHEVL